MRSLIFLGLIGIIIAAFVVAIISDESNEQLGGLGTEEIESLDKNGIGEDSDREVENHLELPEQPSLYGKTWEWVSVSFNDGRTIVPIRAGAFTLTLNANESFSATTDCNSVGGSVTADEQTITFGQMMSTLMYCENSQESEFTQLLTDVTSYHLTSDGGLVLHLKFDSGSMNFR